MDSRHGKIRMNVEGDRLSNLPDDLIHKVLSYIDIREAIQTSALSSRWRHTWTTMPCLNFSASRYFPTLNHFAKFVKHVLANRNNQIEVSFLKLEFHGKVSQVFVKRILEYAFSHNVQQMDISYSPGKQIEFPLSLFCSQSLKHFALYSYIYDNCIMTPPTWELQALTTLNLHRVTLNDESTDKGVGFFSNCANLKNLTLRNCRLMGLNGFNIFHHGLSSLTLEDRCICWHGVNVDAPQLKNLTIRYCSGIHLMSAPNLSSLQYKDYSPLELPADLLLLEKVDICIYGIPSDGKAIAHKFVCMLRQLHSVQFLTLNSELIKLLSSSVELIAHQPSPFANLKSLKIYPTNSPDELMQPRLSRKKLNQLKVTMAPEVRDYLLNSSPSATFIMVSHEEMRDVKNAMSAQKLMTQLQDKLKKVTKTNMTGIEQDTATMLTQFKDMGYTLSKLSSINALLEKVPTSHQDKLQARLSGLNAEVGTIMNYMNDRVKTLILQALKFILYYSNLQNFEENVQTSPQVLLYNFRIKC